MITFEVDVNAGLTDGSQIDHTISLISAALSITDAAQTVFINPFNLNTGNKPLYAETTGVFDRTLPVSNGTTNIVAQGASQAFNVSPTLESSLDLANAIINVPIWTVATVRPMRANGPYRPLCLIPAPQAAR